jgi:pimeloyl-ACP methyl ester carboxylesterase
LTKSAADRQHPGVDRIRAGEVDLCVERLGEPDRPTVLLVAGHGAQLQWWDDDLCELLVSAGFGVVRYDNRDVGDSTSFAAHGEPDIGAVVRGRPAPVAYTLWSMADDAVGVLDALGIERAHVVGASMGGMIGQCLAIAHPDRVVSLCSIMSTTGAPGVGAMTGETLQALVALERRYEDPVERTVATTRHFASPGFAFDEGYVRARAIRHYERGEPPGGVARQLAAMLVSGDRTDALAGLSVPTLVVHGDADAMVPVDGGRATATVVPGAELVVVRGMAHELPRAVWPEMVGAIVAVARRAQRAAAGP